MGTSQVARRKRTLLYKRIRAAARRPLVDGGTLVASTSPPRHQTPKFSFPGPAVPPAPKKVESANIPDSPSEQETVLKHTGCGPGRQVPRVKSAGRRRSWLRQP